MQHIQSLVGDGLPERGLGGQRMDNFPLLSSHSQHWRSTTACRGSKMDFSAARGDPSSFQLWSTHAHMSVCAPRFGTWEILQECGGHIPKSPSYLLFLMSCLILSNLHFLPGLPFSFLRERGKSVFHTLCSLDLQKVSQK